MSVRFPSNRYLNFGPATDCWGGGGAAFIYFDIFIDAFTPPRSCVSHFGPPSPMSSIESRCVCPTRILRSKALQVRLPSTVNSIFLMSNSHFHWPEDRLLFIILFYFIFVFNYSSSRIQNLSHQIEVWLGNFKQSSSTWNLGFIEAISLILNIPN